MKLIPELLGLEGHFGVVLDLLFWLEALQCTEVRGGGGRLLLLLRVRVVMMVAVQSRVQARVRCSGQRVLSQRLGKKPEAREKGGGLRRGKERRHGEVGGPVRVERVISHSAGPRENRISHRCIH